MTPSRTTGWSEEAHLDTINPVPRSEDNWWASVMMTRLISTEGPATKSKLSSFPDPSGRWQVLQLDKAHSHPQVVWSRNYYKPKSNSREEIRNKTKNLLGAKSQATGVGLRIKGCYRLSGTRTALHVHQGYLRPPGGEIGALHTLTLKLGTSFNQS